MSTLNRKRGTRGPMSDAGPGHHRIRRKERRPAAQRDRKAIYGVSTDDLGRSGPSVVSLNGVGASVGIMEFMLGVTGVRSPRRLLKYHGQRGVVTVVSDAPAPDCYYCANVRGRGDAADVYRYITSGVGQYLR